MDALVLSGGRGQRLEPSRKQISANIFPSLQKYNGLEGPKGLAVLSMHGQARPLLDWHLSIYTQTPGLERVFLGLGFSGHMIQDYYQQQGAKFQNIPLYFLQEDNPAGTIAPLVKLKNEYGLPEGPLILSNGDNLLNLNFADIYEDILRRPGLEKSCVDTMVFDIIVPISHRESGNYGVIELDEGQCSARCFHEKQTWEKNPYVLVKGEACSYINTGFSLIPSPRKALAPYLTREIEEMVYALEQGRADYKSHEKFVKYETMYEKMARDGHLGIVKYDGFWADSGTEAQILEIEALTNQGRGLKTSPSNLLQR